MRTWLIALALAAPSWSLAQERPEGKEILIHPPRPELAWFGASDLLPLGGEGGGVAVVVAGNGGRAQAGAGLLRQVWPPMNDMAAQPLAGGPGFGEDVACGDGWVAVSAPSWREGRASEVLVYDLKDGRLIDQPVSVTSPEEAGLRGRGFGHTIAAEGKLLVVNDPSRSSSYLFEIPSLGPPVHVQTFQGVDTNALGGSAAIGVGMVYLAGVAGASAGSLQVLEPDGKAAMAAWLISEALPGAEMVRLRGSGAGALLIAKLHGDSQFLALRPTFITPTPALEFGAAFAPPVRVAARTAGCIACAPDGSIVYCTEGSLQVMDHSGAVIAGEPLPPACVGRVIEVDAGQGFALLRIGPRLPPRDPDDLTSAGFACVMALPGK